jgi:hypothetical protein
MQCTALLIELIQGALVGIERGVLTGAERGLAWLEAREVVSRGAADRATERWNTLGREAEGDRERQSLSSGR